MASDDWRIKITFENGEHGSDLVSKLQELELAEEAKTALGERITVTHSGTDVFLYCDSEQSLKEAERVVNEVVAQLEINATIELGRWHPIEQAWEDPAIPLPDDEASRQVEQERLEQREAAESLGSGFAEWEVQLEFDRHHEAVEFCKQLEEEGLESTRRWRYVFVGAANEDEAQALTDRFTSELPDSVKIEFSLSGKRLLESMPSNPFAFLGGMGG